MNGNTRSTISATVILVVLLLPVAVLLRAAALGVEAGHGSDLAAVVHQAADGDLLVLGDRHLVQQREAVRGRTDGDVSVLEEMTARIAQEVGLLESGQRHDRFDLVQIHDRVVFAEQFT